MKTFRKSNQWCIEISNLKILNQPTHHISVISQKQKMNEIWYVLKIVELGLGCVCIYYHILGIMLEEEAANHSIIYCGTFFGFSLIAIIGNFAACLLSPPSLALETVLGLLGFIFYVATCFTSMYHCEIDTHLSYMSAQEEMNHKYFMLTRYQGIASLICASVFLLHGAFAYDALIYSRRTTKVAEEEELDLNIMMKPWAALLNTKKVLRRMFYQPAETTRLTV